MNQIVSNLLKSKKWIWLIGILISLGLVVAAVNFLFFGPWLQKKLETSVKEQSQGLYTLQMGTLRASLFTGSLTIDKLNIVPDFTLWEQQRATKKTKVPALLVALKAEQLHLAGINYLGLLQNKPVNLDAITGTQPVLHITRMMEDSGASEPLHTKLKGLLVNYR